MITITGSLLLLLLFWFGLLLPFVIDFRAEVRSAVLLPILDYVSIFCVYLLLAGCWLLLLGAAAGCFQFFLRLLYTSSLHFTSLLLLLFAVCCC